MNMTLARATDIVNAKAALVEAQKELEEIENVKDRLILCYEKLMSGHFVGHSGGPSRVRFEISDETYDIIYNACIEATHKRITEAEARLNALLGDEAKG